MSDYRKESDGSLRFPRGAVSLADLVAAAEREFPEVPLWQIKAEGTWEAEPRLERVDLSYELGFIEEYVPLACLVEHAKRSGMDPSTVIVNLSLDSAPVVVCRIRS